MRPQYRHMEVEVPPLAEEARHLLRLWIGDLEPEDAPLLIGAERVLVPWSEAATEAYELHGPDRSAPIKFWCRGADAVPPASGDP